MLRASVIYFTVAADLYTVESSAYIDTQALVKVSGRSFVKIKNSNGPSRLPCGTPHSTELALERLSLKKTLCVLLAR